MSYAVVRTDKLAGTDVRSEICSVRYQPSNTKTAIQNGNVVLLGDLETGSREIYKGDTPAANSALNNVALIATPEVFRDGLTHSLDEYINPADEILRGYILGKTHGIFSVTKDALDGNATPEVGDIVELQAGTKLNVVDSLTSGSTQVGVIKGIDTICGFTYYAIELA